MSNERPTPGLYTGVSNETYHRGPGISKSHLDWAAVTPKHYWAQYIDPAREPEVRTPALILGDAIHVAVLQPDILSERFAVAPAVDRRTTAGKEEYKAFIADSIGKTPLSDDDYKMVSRVRDAVHAHPLAKGLLRGGEAEQTFYANDAETGELIKCRPDYFIQARGGTIIDLKSAADASPTAFDASVFTYRYFVQDPWYRDVIKAATGQFPERFAFVAVEKHWPHAIGVYFLEEDDVERGRLLARRDLRTIVRCKESGRWADYCEGKDGPEPRPIELRRWSQNQINSQLRAAGLPVVPLKPFVRAEDEQS